jgi:hypothetical protein
MSILISWFFSDIRLVIVHFQLCSWGHGVSFDYVVEVTVGRSNLTLRGKPWKDRSIFVCTSRVQSEFRYSTHCFSTRGGYHTLALAPCITVARSCIPTLWARNQLYDNPEVQSQVRVLPTCIRLFLFGSCLPVICCYFSSYSLPLLI